MYQFLVENQNISPENWNLEYFSQKLDMMLWYLIAVAVPGLWVPILLYGSASPARLYHGAMPSYVLMSFYHSK